MPTIQHTEIQQGTTFRANVLVRDENRQPVDLTDCVATATLRREFTSVSYVLFTDIVSNPTSGVLTISMTPEETLALVGGRYVYDVCIKEPDGTTTRVVEGTIEVSPAVTQEVTDDPEEQPEPEEDVPDDWVAQGFF